jgi:hypothetical protein
MKTSRLIILIFGLLINQLIVFSQTDTKIDEVFLKNGTSIKGTVLRVTDSNIEIDPVGAIPFQMVSRKECIKISYSDGTSVDFQNNQNPSTQNSTGSEIAKNGLFDEKGNKISYFQIDFNKPVEIYSAGEFNNYTVGAFKLKYIQDGVNYTIWVAASYNMNTKSYVKGLDLGIIAAGANSVSIYSNYSLLFYIVKEGASSLNFNEPDGGTIENGAPPFTRHISEIKIVMNKDYSQSLPPVDFRNYIFEPTLKITNWVLNDRAKIGNRLAATFEVRMEINIKQD